ncbi:hypothetical protein ACFLSZ_06290 [Candidatus Bipolaricaulota bacterium]
MRHNRFLLFVGLLVLGGLLFGCVGPVIDPPIVVPTIVPPEDYSLYGTANYVPGQFEEDPYPLFVGAQWLYRNAAKYWNPQITASGLLESEVVATVQGVGVECYVLQTHFSNGPDELLYIYRTKNQVALRGSRTVGASGSQDSFSLNPGLAFLELPLEEDKFWPLLTSGGAGEAYVYHREVAAIESGEVRTLLGPYSPIFLGSWRVHFNLPESSPRLYGGPVQFLWFADGVGVVKHVLNSVDYELAEFRLPDEVVLLEEQNDGNTVGVPRGGLVVVQLREGAGDDGWKWVLGGIEGSALEPLGDEFYKDTPRAFSETNAGTHSFQFRAIKTGDVTVWFELGNPGAAEPWSIVEYNIRVN